MGSECQLAFDTLQYEYGYNPGRPLYEGTWGGVPSGCSVQIGGDHTAHFSTNLDTDNSRLITGEFDVLCRYGSAIEYTWKTGEWSECPTSCGLPISSQLRDVECYSYDGFIEIRVDDDNCNETDKPNDSQETCEATQPCVCNNTTIETPEFIGGNAL